MLNKLISSLSDISRVELRNHNIRSSCACNCASGAIHKIVAQIQANLNSIQILHSILSFAMNVIFFHSNMIQNLWVQIIKTEGFLTLSISIQHTLQIDLCLNIHNFLEVVVHGREIVVGAQKSVTIILITSLNKIIYSSLVFQRAFNPTGAMFAPFVESKPKCRIV